LFSISPALLALAFLKSTIWTILLSSFHFSPSFLISISRALVAVIFLHYAGIGMKSSHSQFWSYIFLRSIYFFADPDWKIAIFLKYVREISTEFELHAFELRVSNLSIGIFKGVFSREWDVLVWYNGYPDILPTTLCRKTFYRKTFCRTDIFIERTLWRKYNLTNGFFVEGTFCRWDKLHKNRDIYTEL
jgi:hypothetical protein